MILRRFYSVVFHDDTVNPPAGYSPAISAGSSSSPSLPRAARSVKRDVATVPDMCIQKEMTGRENRIIRFVCDIVRSP